MLLRHCIVDAVIARRAALKERERENRAGGRLQTTNGAYASSFIISRNELEFSREAQGAFCLYRLFRFRESPSMYILRGRHLGATAS
jgi:hypothetical protein